MAWCDPLSPIHSNSKHRTPGCLSYFMVLAALAAVRAGENVEFKTPNVTSRVLDTICPTRNFADIQMEYIRYPICREPRWVGSAKIEESASHSIDLGDVSTSINPGNVPAASATVTATVPVSTGLDQELDTDSPLDNSNFLSFEEWKKQNLAKVGQSAENVGGNRPGAGSAGKGGRQRPVGIDNALDSLGEDAEIELEFGGFAPDDSGPASWERKVGSDQPSVNDNADPVTRGVEGETQGDATPRGGISRRKDAGTTCKERFNYASFDCAATVLKTNPQCTGSSSILIENKDSYMLNECRAKDKFLILELCDDILIDTVVLANYEFFSSIFRTFRVSVSDRYPPKPDIGWKELGTYEAVNSREVQAFAVENPLIWARYVKIEFLSHYGNEFYCPVSLIRVHGTTMLEEYKNDGEAARVDEDIAQVQAVPEPVSDNFTADEVVTASITSTPANVGSTPEKKLGDICMLQKTDIEMVLRNEYSQVCAVQDAPQQTHNQTAMSVQPEAGKPPGAAKLAEEVPSTTPSNEASSSTGGPASTSVEGDSGPQNPSPEPQIETSSSTPKAENETPTEAPKPSPTIQQPPPNPTTQESFFKSVNKRLHMLETNSSLSLQYIEEQSRILRDAFSIVEKRQLAKTSTFLESLNTTVLHELREFRQQYDHVWQSVAIEFEQQRQQYHREVFAVSTQLGILADELVFQKRISIIQSVFVLICFGVVLFSRSTVGSYLELPRMHSMMSRSQSFRSGSPSFESPSASPASRPASSYQDKDVRHSHRRTVSEESREDDHDLVNPTIAYSPPTPTSDSEEHGGGSQLERSERSNSTSSSVVLSPPGPLFRSGSSPPDLGRPEDGDGSQSS
ncbi:hypothetical protein FQN50_008487 [Emmonsiellopsis sp. PD_5]|nr:hypothetical protein FQN50_008487 [Emmonsiellopsis sp. PD_5]